MTKRAHDIQHDPDYSAVGPAVERARERAGLTKLELAKRLDMKPQALNSLMRNERRLDVVELCRIAAATGCSPMDLFMEVTAPVASRAAARPAPLRSQAQDVEELLATA